MERLHVAQPGISAQIRQLERELGQPLLDRTERCVRLTAAGEAFLPYARAALDAASDGAANVTALTGLVQGRLQIGTVGTISSTALDLPELLAGFHATHPGVDIALQEDTTTDLLTGIGHGRLDAAFAEAGLRPRIAFESGDPNLLVRLARAGLGTAVVPASVMAGYEDSRLVGVPLTPRIDGKIGMAWHGPRPLSPAARAFIAHVRDRKRGVEDART